MTNLKVLREVNNYTQEYVAEHIGMDQSTYSKLERNPKAIKAEQAEKLAALYDVTLSEILSPGVTISFSGHIEKNGYVQNHYEEGQKDTVDKVIQAKDGEISARASEVKSLKEEIEHLRMQNRQLLEIIGKK